MHNSNSHTKKINKEPLVSACIPVYNHENHVHSCIKSVIAQDYKNIELIIIDDGSPDKSRERIEELLPQCKERFSRFEFRSRPNKGLCATLNEALEWCQGEYFSAVASDDMWLPNKTSDQVRIFNEAESLNINIGVISGETIAISEEGNILPPPKYRPPPSTYYDFSKIYYGDARISAPTAMIKMDALRKTNGYNPGTTIEDWFMWLSIAKLGYKILANNTYYTRYRTHKNNTFKKIKEMHLAKEFILTHFSQDNKELDSLLLDLTQKTYVAAAIYQKSYAIELIINRRINPLSVKHIKSTILLAIPEKLIFATIEKYRSLRNRITKP